MEPVFALRLWDSVCFISFPTFSLISKDVLRFCSHHRISTGFTASKQNVRPSLVRVFTKQTAIAVAVLSHACASASLFFPQTVTFDRFFQEASIKEVKRIYRAEQVVLHSPVVHLQQKTPGHIFFFFSQAFTAVCFMVLGGFQS